MQDTSVGFLHLVRDVAPGSPLLAQMELVVLLLAAASELEDSFHRTLSLVVFDAENNAYDWAREKAESFKPPIEGSSQ